MYTCTHMYTLKQANTNVTRYVHFSPPADGYNNRLTVHVCTVTKSSTVLLLRLLSSSCLMSVSAGVVYKWLYLAWTSRESPHDWLVRIAMDLATFSDMWG